MDYADGGVRMVGGHALLRRMRERVTHKFRRGLDVKKGERQLVRVKSRLRTTSHRRSGSWDLVSD